MSWHNFFLNTIGKIRSSQNLEKKMLIKKVPQDTEGKGLGDRLLLSVT